MSSRLRILSALLVCLAGAALSALLLLQHHGEGQAAVAALCGEAQGSGCEAVDRSGWSELGGVPLAALGLAFYLSLAALLGVALAAEEPLRRTLAAGGLALLAAALLADLALLGLQAFVIGAYCRLCLLTYLASAAAFGLLWPERRLLVGVRPAAARPEGRVALAGWIAASLAVVAGVAAGEAALRARAVERGLALLGASPASSGGSGAAPAASPAPTASSVPAGDPEHWRQEAQRLQAVLDDPQKLQQYLADRALHEFETGAAQSFDLDRAPRNGPAQAPIRVVTFSDFLCPWCRSLAQGLHGFLPQTGGRVAIVFKHFPLDQECNPQLKTSVHPGACLLALGSVCAHEQGRFWPFHDAVYASERKDAKREDVLRIAGGVGLDAGRFEACLASPQARARLDADVREAVRVGVAATPSVFINGRRLPSLNLFAAAIDTESKRLGLPPLSPPSPPPAR